ncbi:MAG: hypothetical protein NC041_01115 [Bacteroides sp.]|nr:hypothetical protein [Prevotella sp.]MCM1408075.1 hypothetical protein [Treponema brennaborense]MCM1469051.1 hypothetical protein [Bacteroides sp.]
MNISKRKIFIVFAAAVAAGGLCSCTTAMAINIAANDSAEFELTAQSGTAVKNLLQSDFGTENIGDFLIDKPVQKKLAEKKITIKNSGNAIAQPYRLHASAPDFRLLFAEFADMFRISEQNGTTALEIDFSPETFRQLSEQNFGEFSEYLELLMAPLFTGEQMSAAEYMELIAAVYGETAAHELESAEISAVIHVPAKTARTFISKEAVGTIASDKNSAVIVIPLVQFLTNSAQSLYRIEWKNTE